ncbi:MAG: SURF1 family protein [Nevskiaceae bacterium]|nr:MAG: SURF1 family protein [Nevskiaceae bacterium]TAM25317.1 MAG: SURF1 family protein [Nevskiaceae bacterium]
MNPSQLPSSAPKLRLRFRPAWWALLGTLLLGGAMLALGYWQYGRGQTKQQLLDRHAAAAALVPVPLLADSGKPAVGEVRRVYIDGVYRSDLSVLLDNQSHHRRPGAHAWTPLQLADGSLVVVDRGWLPLDVASVPPAPTGPQRLEGYWRTLPQPGLRLGQAGAACAPGAALAPRVNYPDLAELRCRFGATTRDGLLELAPELPGGFVREWSPAGVDAIPPQRHYGYAAQWWAFAATLVGLFIKLNLKKVPV